MRFGTILFGLCLSFMASNAAGHRESHPKHSVVVFEPGGIRWIAEFRLSKGEETAGIKADLDLDGNGVLDPEEQRKIQARLVTFATFGLTVSVDGVRLVPESREVRLLGMGRPNQALGVRVEDFYPVEWSPLSRAFEIRDHLPVRSQPISGVCKAEGLRVTPCGPFHMNEKESYQGTAHLVAK